MFDMEFNTSGALSECMNNAFGPVVLRANCRSGFDFTLMFEETVLSIVPSTILLILVPFRLFRLYKSSTKVVHNIASYMKIVIMPQPSPLYYIAKISYRP